MATHSPTLPRGFAGYVALLRQNPDIRKIWLAQAISNMGDWFNSVALLGLINQYTTDALAPALVTVFTVLPSALAGLTISGYIADRIDRKALAVAMDVARAFVALALLLVRSPEALWVAYAATIAMSLGESIFGPAIAAAQPNLCKPHELATANALQQSTWASMSMIGAFLGGVVAQTFGKDAAFVVNAVSFLGSAVCIVRVRGSFRQPGSHSFLTGVSLLHSLTEGFRFLRQHPRLLAFSLAKPIWASSFAAVGLFSVYAYQVYNLGDIGTSWLYAARGAGSVIGPLAVQARFMPHKPSQYARLLGVSLALCAIGYAVWGGSTLPALGMIGVFVGHLGGGNVWTFSRIMVQKESPDYLRGRVLSLDSVGFSLTVGVLSFAIGLLARYTSPAAGALFGVSLSVVSGAAWWAYMRRTVLRDDRVL